MWIKPMMLYCKKYTLTFQIFFNGVRGTNTIKEGQRSI